MRQTEDDDGKRCLSEHPAISPSLPLLSGTCPELILPQAIPSTPLLCHKEEGEGDSPMLNIAVFRATINAYKFKRNVLS